jgi:hypothetical protein
VCRGVYGWVMATRPCNPILNSNLKLNEDAFAKRAELVQAIGEDAAFRVSSKAWARAKDEEPDHTDLQLISYTRRIHNVLTQIES